MSDHRSAGTALTVDNVTKTFRIHHERASSLKQYIAAGGRNHYEEFVAFLDAGFTRALVSRESATEPLNFLVRDYATGALTPLTSNRNPHPAFNDVRR